MQKNIIFAFLANLLNAGLAWLILLFLIRFGSDTDIGFYSLGQAVALPIYMFFTLKLRTVQLTDTNSNFSNSDYFNARILLSMASIIITIVISIIFYLHEINHMLTISLLGIGYAAMLIREHFISIYQKNERNEYFLYSNIIFGLATYLTFILVYVLTNNIITTIMVFSVSRLIALITDIIILRKYFNEFISVYFKSFNKRQVISLMKLGLPLGITAVVGTLLTSIPRIKLESTVGLGALGVFTTLMSLVAFFNLFMASLNQALIPRLSKLYSQSKRKINTELLIWFIILLIGLSICLIFTYFYSAEIISIIFGAKYIKYRSEFILAILAGCSISIFHYSNMLLNIQKSFNSQIFIYILCTAICFISSLILIPLYKLEGAIIVSIISSLFGSFISILIYSKNFIRKR